LKNRPAGGDRLSFSLPSFFPSSFFFSSLSLPGRDRPGRPKHPGARRRGPRHQITGPELFLLSLPSFLLFLSSSMATCWPRLPPQACDEEMAAVLDEHARFLPPPLFFLFSAAGRRHKDHGIMPGMARAPAGRPFPPSFFPPPLFPFCLHRAGNRARRPGRAKEAGTLFDGETSSSLSPLFALLSPRVRTAQSPRSTHKSALSRRRAEARLLPSFSFPPSRPSCGTTSSSGARVRGDRGTRGR